MTTEVVMVGPADLGDQRWLDERIDTARNGIEAVIDIALNWTGGRNVSRLHPGVAPADYVREHVGLLGRDAIVPLLTETNWSNRQIAAVAGVSRNDVNELALSVPVDRPATTLGADGKLRPVAPFRPRLDPTPYFNTPETTEPVQPEKGKVRQKINLTEARGYVRVIENNLAMLQPDEVVPSAYPALRELVPALMAWVQLWALEDDAESVK